jgi:predicted enzyme related to lactoylglutathione lyase
MRHTPKQCGAGHEVIYGPVDEPLGVRRFFVRDPQGVVISVLAHG